MNKYTANYPDGEQTINKDSMGSIARQYSYDCSTGIKNLHYRAWTPQFTSTFKNVLLKTPLAAQIKAEYQSKFCDCFIDELKSKYPNGLTKKVSQSDQDSISISCAYKIKVNK